MKLSEIKRVLRSGKYAWPGGYPMFFVTGDGEALSFEAACANFREIVAAHKGGDRHDQWYLVDYDINYEDPYLYCAHTGDRIESAYADDIWEIGQ